MDSEVSEAEDGMALKINIKPGEKIIVNGAVITIAEGGSALILQNHAVFLRGKDIMQQEDATTPARKIYFYLMLMYLDADSQQIYYGTFMEYMNDLMKTTTLRDVADSLMIIFRHVQRGDFYKALKVCKALVDFEAELLKAPPTTEQGAAAAAR
jgi:flagellar biosynthesis repressor protein FlbT